MARVFLDTNIFIDLVEGRGSKNIARDVDGHHVLISPLSTHIMYNVQKKEVPDHVANGTISQFEVIDLTVKIHDKSLNGPTSDFEDNIQLHSAIESSCDYFLTNDRKLLKMGYFGKTRILNTLAKPDTI